MLLLLSAICALGSATGDDSVAKALRTSISEEEDAIKKIWSATGDAALSEAVKTKAIEMFFKQRVAAWEEGSIVRTEGHANDVTDDHPSYAMEHGMWDSWLIRRKAIQQMASKITKTTDLTAVWTSLKDGALESAATGHWRLRVANLATAADKEITTQHKLQLQLDVLQHLRHLLSTSGEAHFAVQAIEQEILQQYADEEAAKQAAALAKDPPAPYTAPTAEELEKRKTKAAAEATTRVRARLKDTVDYWAARGTKDQIVVFHQAKHTIDSRVLRRILGNQIKTGKVSVPLIYVYGKSQGAATLVHDFTRECSVPTSALVKGPRSKYTHDATRIVLIPDENADDFVAPPGAEEGQVQIIYDDYVMREDNTATSAGDFAFLELREAIFTAMQNKKKLTVFGTGSMRSFKIMMSGGNTNRPFRSLEQLNESAGSLRFVWEGRAMPNSGLFEHTNDWKDSADVVLPKTKALAHYMTRIHASFNSVASGGPELNLDEAQQAAMESIYGGDLNDDKHRLSVSPQFLDHIRTEGVPLTAGEGIEGATALFGEIESTVMFRAVLEHLTKAEATFVGLPGAIAAGATSEIVSTLSKDKKLLKLVAPVLTEENKESKQPRVLDVMQMDTILGHINALYSQEKYKMFKGLYGDSLYKTWSQKEDEAMRMPGGKVPEADSAAAKKIEAHDKEWTANGALSAEYHALKCSELRHELVRPSEKLLEAAQKRDAPYTEQDKLHTAVTEAIAKWTEECEKRFPATTQILVKQHDVLPEALMKLLHSVRLPQCLTALYVFAGKHFKPLKSGTNGRFQYVGMEAEKSKVIQGKSAECWGRGSLTKYVMGQKKTKGLFQLVDSSAASKAIWALAVPGTFKDPLGYVNGDDDEGGMSTGTVIAIIVGGIAVVAGLGAGIYYGCA